MRFLTQIDKIPFKPLVNTCKPTRQTFGGTSLTAKIQKICQYSKATKIEIKKIQSGDTRVTARQRRSMCICKNGNEARGGRGVEERPELNQVD